MSFRTKMAWVSLVSACILWPVSMFSFAKDEMPVTLSLSWAAIIYTAVDVIGTNKVRDHEEED